MRARSHEAGIVLGLLLATLAVRLAVVEWRGAVLSADSSDYLILARNLDETGTFSLDASPPVRPSIRRPPGYPAFLCLLRVGGGDSLGVIVVAQAFLDGLVAAMVYLLGRLAVPRKWAIGAALAYCAHPGAAATTVTILSEPLFRTLITAAAAALAYSCALRRPALSALAGALLGCAILTRSAALPLPILLGMAVWWAMPGTRRQARYPLALAACAGAVIAPWIVRSSLLADGLVLVQGSSGAPIFYVASKVDWDQADESRLWGQLRADPICGRAQGPLFGADLSPEAQRAADRICVEAALRNIRARPGRYLRSRFEALPHLFLHSFDSFTQIDMSFRAAIDGRHWPELATKAGLLLVFALAPALLALAAVARLTHDPATAVSLLTCGWVVLVQLPLFIEPRFWSPVVPLQLVAASSGLYGLAKWWSSRRGASPDGGSREPVAAAA